jgi:hypothetical protein
MKRKAFTEQEILDKLRELYKQRSRKRWIGAVMLTALILVVVGFIVHFNGWNGVSLVAIIFSLCVWIIVAVYLLE